VPGRYRRLLEETFCFGWMRQNPLSSVPSRPAKQAGDAKFGQQSQSIDPFLLTSAALSQSPIRA
jgi:hypothetical protein